MKKQVLFVIIMLLPIVASAASTTFVVNDILYKTSGLSGEVSVNRFSFELAGDVVIPETVEYEGEIYNVTSIDNNAALNCTGLTSITIPSCVRTIGANAFRGCTNLSTVNLAYGLKTIETGAFRDCTALTSIIIPKRMRSISKEAFAGCTGLTSIYSEEYTPFPIGDAFSPETYSNATLSVPYYTKRLYQTMKGWDQFSKIDERDAIKSATIHVAVAGTLHDYISDDEKYNIEELSLSGELNGADFCLLREMTGNDTDGYETEGRLRVLDLSQTKLVASDVKFMESTYCVWDYRVSASTGISNKTINDPSEFPGYSFCGCISLISITFPKDITAIGDYAFEGCGILAEINVPDGVSSIGTRAFGFFSDFYPTPYWMEIHPDGLMYTGKVLYAYKGEMAPDTTIELEEGTTGIAGSAFSYNSSHSGEGKSPVSIIITNSVKNIGDCAFGNCTLLTDVTCQSKTVPETNTNAFYNSNIENATLHVPAASLEDYKATIPWNSFKEVVAIDGDVPGTQKCTKPVISFVNGQLSFECETEGVEYHYEIFTSVKGTGNSIKLPESFTVSVYASKEGLLDSEVVKTEIPASAIGDLNHDGVVNAADAVKLVDIIMEQEQ